MHSAHLKGLRDQDIYQMLFIAMFDHNLITRPSHVHKSRGDPRVQGTIHLTAAGKAVLARGNVLIAAAVKAGQTVVARQAVALLAPETRPSLQKIFGIQQASDGSFTKGEVVEALRVLGVLHKKSEGKKSEDLRADLAGLIWRAALLTTAKPSVDEVKELRVVPLRWHLCALGLASSTRTAMRLGNRSVLQRMLAAHLYSAEVGNPSRRELLRDTNVHLLEIICFKLGLAVPPRAVKRNPAEAMRGGNVVRRTEEDIINALVLLIREKLNRTEPVVTVPALRPRGAIGGDVACGAEKSTLPPFLVPVWSVPARKGARALNSTIQGEVSYAIQIQFKSTHHLLLRMSSHSPHRPPLRHSLSFSTQWQKQAFSEMWAKVMTTCRRHHVQVHLVASADSMRNAIKAAFSSGKVLQWELDDSSSDAQQREHFEETFLPQWSLARRCTNRPLADEVYTALHDVVDKVRAQRLAVKMHGGRAAAAAAAAAVAALLPPAAPSPPMPAPVLPAQRVESVVAQMLRLCGY